jgi:hypothetical protein
MHNGTYYIIMAHRMACELLAEFKRETLVNQKPASKPSGTMAKQKSSPEALHPQTE